MSVVAQWLPRFAEEAANRFPYGARSEAAVYVGDLLCEEVPAVSAGELEIVAIARRPGVLSKIAVRARAEAQPVPMIGSGVGLGSGSGVGVGADHIARVRERLDGERIDVIAWQRSAPAYISDALGLGELPPILLLPGIQHAHVLLGEIDVRGIAGWRGLNTVLASALTGWRIRLAPVAATVAWRRLEAAMRERRPVAATVIGHTERGLRLDVLGLYAVLSAAAHHLVVGKTVDVRVTRMDPDEGRIVVSTRLAATGQLALPLA